MGRDGRFPYADLVAVDGTLYGTTEEGGKHNGTVFSITPYGTEKVLHTFGGRGDGAGPQAGLLDVNGTLYGTTVAGGSSGCNGYICGTVFSITPSGKEKVNHRFGGTGDGDDPFGGLVYVNGTLYGTTSNGYASGIMEPCSRSRYPEKKPLFMPSRRAAGWRRTVRRPNQCQRYALRHDLRGRRIR